MKCLICSNELKLEDEYMWICKSITHHPLILKCLGTGKTFGAEWKILGPNKLSIRVSNDSNKLPQFDIFEEWSEFELDIDIYSWSHKYILTDNNPTISYIYILDLFYKVDKLRAFQ